MRSPLVAARLVRAGRAILVYGALVSGWWLLLAHNLRRGEALFAQVTDQPSRNVLALSADFLEYRDYYRAFPTRIAEFSAHTTLVEYYKRPLYGPVSAGLSWIAHRLLGLDFPARMFLVLSCYASMATLLLYQLVRSTALPRLESVLLTSLAASGFAWLSVFSVPESYSLSVCATLLAALSGSRVPTFVEPRGRRSAFRHAIVSGLAGWVYLPAAGAILLLLPRVTARKEYRTIVVPATLLTLLLVAAPHLLAGSAVIEQQVTYAERWTSWRHFGDWRILADVAAAFLMFGFISPVADFLHASPAVDLGTALARGPVLAGGLLLGTVYVLLARSVTRSANPHRLLGAGLWLAALYTFHLWYNPREVLLYLSVPVAVLVYLMALALSQARERSDAGGRDVPRWAVPAFGLLLLLTGFVTWPAIVGGMRG